jgi:hypothetical protein
MALNVRNSNLTPEVFPNLTPEVFRINSRYAAEISAVRQTSRQKQTPLVRDEFDTDAEFKAKIAKQQSSYSDRIAELEGKKQNETNDLERRLTGEQQNQTADLRQSLKQLAEREFTVGAESVIVELGAYNPDKQSFPVTIRNRTPNVAQPEESKKKGAKKVLAQKKEEFVKVAMNGVIPLPKDAARTFKQEHAGGLIRPQVAIRAGSGEIVSVALANDSDSSIYEYRNGEFITVAERDRREAAAAAERDRLIYTDPQSGLMWTRDGNIAGKEMTWDDAMSWVKNLNYAGYSDWRLPTKDELVSFAKRGGNRPSEWFNANGFRKVPAGWFWSATENGSNYFWGVHMNVGVVNYNSLYNGFYVWPVRSGQ